MRLLGIGLALVVLSHGGCAAVGDFFVPRHNASGILGPDLSCITIHRAEVKAGVLAPLAAVAAGFLVDKAAAAIQDEANRYKASYSATAKTKFVEGGQVIQDLVFTRWRVKQGSLTSCQDLETATVKQGEAENYEAMSRDHLQRAANPNSTEAARGDFRNEAQVYALSAQKKRNESETISKALGASALFNLVLRVEEVLGQRTVYQLNPVRLSVIGVKAKVRAISYFKPWSWWMALDNKSGIVELKAKVALSTIVIGKEGAKPTELLLVDLPLGEIDLNKDTKVKALNIQPPGWFILPIAGERDTNSSVSPTHITVLDGVPVSVTVSIEEADDLGDVLKKGAEKIGENKSKIVEVILDKTGLKAP